MGAIIYLFQRNIVNSIKELKKKPLKLIIYVGIGFLILVSLKFSVQNNTGLGDKQIEIYRSIFLGLIIMFLFISLKSGIEKGNTLFRLSDVNFLFTAPIKSQLILFYGFIKQMGSNIMLMVLLAFQMPNLYNNFPMKAYGWAIILVASFLFALLASIMGVLIYSLASIEEKYKKIINYALYGLVGLVLLGVIYHVIKIGNPLQGAIDFFNRPFFNHVPIIGWLLNIYTSAILGFQGMTVIYIALLVLLAGGCLWIIYSLDLDYYEDALNNSITKEERLVKTRSGHTAWNQSDSKTRKIRGKINHTKARAILSKQILEARKTGTIFVDKSTLFISVFSLIFAYIVRDNGVNFLLYMLVYMKAILSQSNLWSSELEKHYIYLIPEEAIKKIINATLLENIKALITGLITFSLATFIYDISLTQGIILGITYSSFALVILYSDLVIRRMLGAGLNLVAERLLRLLIIAIMLVPGIILSFILAALINEYTGGQGVYLILILYNLLVSLLFIALSKGVFEKIDMR